MNNCKLFEHLIREVVIQLSDVEKVIETVMNGRTQKSLRAN